MNTRRSVVYEGKPRCVGSMALTVIARYCSLRIDIAFVSSLGVDDKYRSVDEISYACTLKSNRKHPGSSEGPM